MRFLALSRLLIFLIAFMPFLSMAEPLDHPLYIAVMKGDVATVSKAVKQGADINQPDKYGIPLLNHAAHFNQYKMVEYLIQAGAKVNQTDESGMSPMLVAATNGYGEIAKLLLRHGADPELADKDGLTPVLAWAQRQNDASLRQPSRAKERTLGKDASNEGHNEITLAIRNGEFAKAISLIEKAGESPWLVSTKVFQEVAEPNKHVTVLGGEIPAPERYPLLAAVAALGEVNVVQALLNKGAKINELLPKEGSTALMFAAKMKQIDMVLFLLSKGADPTLATTDGKSMRAVDFAMALAHSGDDERVSLALLAEPFAVQTLAKSTSVQIRVLLETAAYKGLLKVVRRLKNMDVDMFLRNRLGATPLHYALMGGIPGCDEVAVFLLSQGADPNQYYATDQAMAMAKAGRFKAYGRREGKTPLLIAIDERADASLIEGILKSGGDVNLPSLMGISPLDSAKNHKREDLVALFLRYGGME